MHSEFSFRALTEKDFPIVVAAYHQQWGEKNSSDLISRSFMAALFEINTFALGVFKERKVLGLLLAHVVGEKKMRLSPSWISHKEYESRLMHENHDSPTEFTIIRSANERIRRRLRKRNRAYRARLDFLWVAANTRGQGIGKSMLRHFHAYLLTLNVKAYALFTDPYSDLSFYQRAPWVRIAQEHWGTNDPRDYSLCFARTLI